MRKKHLLLQPEMKPKSGEDEIMEGTWEGSLGFRKKFLVGDKAVILEIQEGKKKVGLKWQ